MKMTALSIFLEATMNTNKTSAGRRMLLTAYLGIILLMLGCVVSGGGAQTSADGVLRLEDGIVEVQDENGDWTPVAGSATFELVGELESTEPWTVAGTTFETNELTQVEEGLETGTQVRVKGAVLEDGSWVAYSIESTEDETDPIIILIGVVNSVDPWVVNDIELNVTEETDIQGEIATGMLVRVEVLLLPDGTWEVLSIAPLGEPTETAGCANVVATVVSVEGNEIQFLGWPTTVILDTDADNDDNEQDNENDDNENEGDADEDEGEDDDENNNEDEDGDNGAVISVGQNVLAVVCVSEAGTLVIVNIVILNDDDDGSADNGEKVLVCHKPNNKKGGHTLSIASSAVPAHLGHGDTMGPCP
jgi:hypothetical protein